MIRQKFKIELNSRATIFYLATGTTNKNHPSKRIHKNSPGRKITIKLDNLEKIITQRDFIKYEKPPNLTEKIIETTFECLKEAVRRRVENNEDPAVMLGGGIDSILLAALITKYNENLTVINIVIPNLYSEYETASKIAEHLNISIIRFEIKEDDSITKEYIEASEYIEEPTPEQHS